MTPRPEGPEPCREPTLPDGNGPLPDHPYPSDRSDPMTGKRTLPDHTALEARMLKAALDARDAWVLKHDRCTVLTQSISMKCWLLDGLRAALMVYEAEHVMYPTNLTAGGEGNPAPLYRRGTP